MLKERKWVVGDVVAVVYRPGFGRSVKKQRVAKVMKLYVELEDGSRWRLSGYQRGGDSWARAHIELWGDQHDRRTLEEDVDALLHRCSREVKLRDLSGRALDAVKSALQAALVESGAQVKS